MPTQAPPSPDVIHPLVEEAVRFEIEQRLCFLGKSIADSQKSGGLTRKEKELILLSIAYAHMRAAPAQLHARAAIRAGASMAEIAEISVLAIIARLSTTGTTDDESIPDTTRSGRANAIISPSRWYKKSVRSEEVWCRADCDAASSD